MSFARITLLRASSLDGQKDWMAWLPVVRTTNAGIATWSTQQPEFEGSAFESLRNVWEMVAFVYWPMLLPGK
jgi:hypothetical protein